MPNTGSTAGGNTVTINGSKLGTGTTTVTFGGVSGTNVVVAGNQNSLTVTVPPHAAGAVDVTVTVPTKVPATLTNGYTYVTPPTVTSLSATSGPSGGGLVFFHFIHTPREEQSGFL